VKVPDDNGLLSLHTALIYNAWLGVIKILFEAYPQAAEVQKHNGNLPLHDALKKKKSKDIVKMLLQAYPEAKEIKSNDGDLPIDIALNMNASFDVITLLKEAQKEPITKPCTARMVDSYIPNSHCTDTAEIPPMASATITSIEASSNFNAASKEIPAASMLPKPTRNNGWTWRNEMIYIENKTEYMIKLIVYYKDGKIEAPRVLNIEPKKRILLEADKACTGIYCDILCNKSSINSTLGWAFDYFIEKGSTQQVIGAPQDLQQAM
jgi:hypothetical protein